MGKIIVTKHAFVKAKERCGLGKKSTQRIAERAHEKGISENEATGQLYRWIMGRCTYNNKLCCSIRIYGEHAFLFDGCRLITVYKVPNNLRNNLKKYQHAWGIDNAGLLERRAYE